ncbi:MAG: tyrosine-type recombinase/integrase [Acidobacteriota bacterium]
MSVTVVAYKRRGQPRAGAWQVNIRTVLPSGIRIRERRKAPVSSRSGALRWGQAREQELLFPGRVETDAQAPTLAEFAPRFIEGHARANRQKPSGVAAKEMILRVHLLPSLGAMRLDSIGSEDVQRLKSQLKAKAPKTVNNVLTVLNTILRVALEWGVIAAMPCAIRMLPAARPIHASFYSFDHYARLLAAAKQIGLQALIVALLGGDAGLRCGEMRALEWTDIDLDKRLVRIQRSDWRGQVSSPKGGRPRVIPMTARLAAALREHRHLRGKRVLCLSDGAPLTERMVRSLVEQSARRAGVECLGVHALRHSFCSHLAMRGVPGRAIQELAGHSDLSTSQRYMHLSPAAVEEAIRRLEQPSSGELSALA